MQEQSIVDTRTRVILAVGRIGAGKNVLGDLLVEEFGYIPVAYADTLKEIAARMGGFPVTWCYTRFGKEQRVPVAPEHTVGTFLQQLGTNVGRLISPNMWVRHAIERIKTFPSGSKIVITDCRFLNEVDVMRQAFPLTSIVYMDRRAEELEGSRDPNHPSELGVDDIVSAYDGGDQFYHVPNEYLTLDDTLQFMRTVVRAFDVQCDYHCAAGARR